MAHLIGEDDLDHVIAVLNRNRHIKVYTVLAGILLALTTMVVAAAAMYSADPAARILDATANK